MQRLHRYLAIAFACAALCAVTSAVLPGPVRAETPVQLAQLNIELGSPSGCSDLEPGSCGKHRKEHSKSDRREHESKKDRRHGVDGGIGILLDVPVIIPGKTAKKKPGKTSTAKPKPEPKSQTKSGKKPAKKPVKPEKPKAKQKDEAKPAETKPVPQFVPPEFPAFETRDCDDCWDLWLDILWYESIIAEDSRKLFESRQEIEDRKAEIERLRAKIGTAGQIDKVFYGREIARHEEYITSTGKLNDELADLITREWAILLDRIDQYTECIDRFCPLPPPPPVAEVPSTPPLPPPVAQPPLSYDPQTEITITGWPYKPTYTFDSGKGYTWTHSSGTGQPPPASYRPPDDDRKICGPDVTDAVIATLRKIRADFLAAPEKQAAACRSLIDPRTGGYAWDMLELSPGSSVPPTLEGQKPYSYEKESDAWVQRDKDGKPVHWKRPWFTGVSHLCAIPRNDPECAPTVEFFGICEHAQVVNYVQWRFMLGLCGGAYPYAGTLLHRAWNYSEYGDKAPTAAQSTMSHAGEKILEKLEANPDETDFSDIRKTVKDLDDARANKPIRNCELKCNVKIDTPFGYRWVGLTEDRPYTTERLDRDVRTIGGEGWNKVKAMISKKTGIDVSKLSPGYVFDKLKEAVGR